MYFVLEFRVCTRESWRQRRLVGILNEVGMRCFVLDKDNEELRMKFRIWQDLEMLDIYLVTKVKLV